MKIRNELLDEIAAYCRAVGIKESTFGRLAVNDGKFVARIRAGGNMTLETVSRVQTYIAANPSKKGVAA